MERAIFAGLEKRQDGAEANPRGFKGIEGSENHRLIARAFEAGTI